MGEGEIPQEEQPENKWENVGRGRNNHNDQRHSNKTRRWRYPKGTISFYVSNLPMNCTSMDMKQVFEHAGELVDAYATNKKDRTGSFFGFVRYCNIGDKKEFEKKLNGTKMRNLILSVNLAIFDRDGNPTNPQRTPPPHCNTGGGSHRQPRTTSESDYDEVKDRDLKNALQKVNEVLEDGLLKDIFIQLSEVVGSRHYICHSSPYGMYPKQVELSVPYSQLLGAFSREWLDATVILTFAITVNLGNLVVPTTQLWSKGTLWGSLSNIQSLHNLKNIIHDAGFNDCHFKYVGGLQILIFFQSIDEAKSFFNMTNIWKPWFSHLAPWSGQIIPYERIATIRIYGVPVHLWDKFVFDSIGESIGRIVQPSDANLNHDIVSYNQVGVLINNVQRVDEEICLKWRDNTFRIWIKEDGIEWCPEFLSSPVCSDETHVSPAPLHRDGTSDSSIPRNYNGSEKLDRPCFGTHILQTKKQPLSTSFKSPAKKNLKPSLGRAHVDFSPTNNSAHSLTISRKRPRMMDCEFELGQSPDGGLMKFNEGEIAQDTPDHSDDNSIINKQAELSEAMPHNTSSPPSTLDLENMARLEEAAATIKFGAEVGVPLENMTDMVLEAIEGEETKKSTTENIPFTSIWGDSSFHSAASPSGGRSGGLACCWEQGVFDVQNSICSKNFIMVSGHWKGINEMVNLVNVYAPQPAAEKKALWEELMNLINGKPGLWVFMGDFNAIRCIGDRSTNHPLEIEDHDFNHFIRSAGLNEFNMGGDNFTWIKDDGTVLSKLDRFFVCNEFISIWPLSTVTALKRKWSDHNPLILITSHLDYGPCPFRLYNSWLNEESLDQAVNNSWARPHQRGKPDFMLNRKLKRLKDDLKNWRDDKNKEKAMIRNKLDALIHDMEHKAGTSGLTIDERKSRMEAKKQLQHIELMEKKDLIQKSRIKWLQDGDENSSFFHGIINGNKKRNRIHGLKIGDEWITNPTRRMRRWV
ncbi:hypothetical protein QVD17_34682 [Tagetes erecta]|uniref:RRM domain-containing protein n=1 Tax=Tagetes erecta TaxID=13708 RepID=A0AAD8JYR4_TARER|nr:hypothetical protein QVD17_34682 [Tagetes erecta]